MEGAGRVSGVRVLCHRARIRDRDFAVAERRQETPRRRCAVVAAGARDGGVISFFALLGIFDQERSYHFGADLRFVLRLFLISV
jgi:hypothetical protein